MESLIGKKLLLLGGTKQACDAVEVAKEMQIETFVADYYSDSPAKKIADHSFAISTHDVDKLIRLCFGGCIAILCRNMQTIESSLLYFWWAAFSFHKKEWA